MTREEAIAIIRKEYLCVDRDCDIERSCGKCDLMMPTKEPILEAYKMAIKALEQEPCDDVISRDMALEKMADYLASGYADSAEDFEEYARIICQLPPVNPQPKTGHWIVTEDGFECSECGCISRSQADSCQYCGCRMVEPQESEE